MFWIAWLTFLCTGICKAASLCFEGERSLACLVLYRLPSHKRPKRKRGQEVEQMQTVFRGDGMPVGPQYLRNHATSPSSMG